MVEIPKERKTKAPEERTARTKTSKSKFRAEDTCPHKAASSTHVRRTATGAQYASPLASPSPGEQIHSENELAQNWAKSSPCLAQQKHGETWVSPIIHTLGNILLFSEVDQRCWNECAPGTERILFTFCAKAWLVVTLTRLESSNSFIRPESRLAQWWKFGLSWAWRSFTKLQTRGENFYFTCTN